MTGSTQGAGSEESSVSSYQQIAAAVVHSSAVGLGEILKKYPGEAERAELARAYVDKIRFFPDQSGYFFVYTLDCVNIALPNPNAWQGKNLYDHRDTKGKYVIRELAAVVRKGGGWVEYYWPKPGQAGEYRKMSYAEPVPNTGYFIGTGFYL